MGHRGENYEQGEDVATTAKRIRRCIKLAQKSGELARAKLSIRCRRYAGGQSIDVEIVSVPFELVRYVEGDDVAHYERYTPETKELLSKLEEIVESYRRDDSDSMTDYYNANFWGSVRVEPNYLAEELEKVRKAYLESEAPDADIVVSQGELALLQAAVETVEDNRGAVDYETVREDIDASVPKMRGLLGSLSRKGLVEPQALVGNGRRKFLLAAGAREIVAAATDAKAKFALAATETETELAADARLAWVPGLVAAVVDRFAMVDGPADYRAAVEFAEAAFDTIALADAAFGSKVAAGPDIVANAIDKVVGDNYLAARSALDAYKRYCDNR